MIEKEASPLFHTATLSVSAVKEEGGQLSAAFLSIPHSTEERQERYNVASLCVIFSLCQLKKN